MEGNECGTHYYFDDDNYIKKICITPSGRPYGSTTGPIPSLLVEHLTPDIEAEESHGSNASTPLMPLPGAGDQKIYNGPSASALEKIDGRCKGKDTGFIYYMEGIYTKSIGRVIYLRLCNYWYGMNQYQSNNKVSELRGYLMIHKRNIPLYACSNMEWHGTAWILPWWGISRMCVGITIFQGWNG